MVETLPEDVVTVKWIWILAVVVVVLMMIMSVIALFTSKSSLAFNIKFVDISNRPYNVQEILTHYRIDDRQLLEHAVETSVTGSPDAAGSDIRTQLPGFLDAYKLSYYAVAIKKNSQNLVMLDNIPRKCGDSLEGFCTDSSAWDWMPQPGKEKAKPCGIGWAQISEGANRCQSGRICCAENVLEYEQRNKKYSRVPCGEFSLGTCNPEALVSTFCDPSGNCPVSVTHCAEGRIHIDDTGDCEKPNDGKTKACCLKQDPKLLADMQLAASASVPLFYKNGLFGELVVTTSG